MIYNPFKPHIVQFPNGKYAIRKYGFPFWDYLDSSDLNYWWSTSSFVYKYCTFNTLEAAKKALDTGVAIKGKVVYQ